MHKLIEKRNYIILFIIILLFLFLLAQMFSTKKEYSKSYNYFNHYIVVKIYENKDIFTKINNIYKEYDNAYKGKNDKLLKDIITYGREVYKKTDGFVDISKKKLTDEKTDKFKTKINNITVKSKDDIDIDSIIGSLATNEVVELLKENNIDEYLINDNGDVTTGNYYKDGAFNISINNPVNNDILEIVSLENKSMASRNISSKTESYMVNPIESKVTKKYDSVVVIADNIKEASMLANALYLMDKKDGEELIKKYNASALWYVDDEIYTLNFDKYIGG